MGTEFYEGRETLDRRQAIKKAAVGAAAAGVVWSAPKVQGLSLRPNYAAASSTSPNPTATVTAPVTAGGLTVGNNAEPLGNGDVAVTSVFASPTSIGIAYAFNTLGGSGLVLPVAIVGSPNAVAIQNMGSTLAEVTFDTLPTNLTFTFTCA